MKILQTMLLKIVVTFLFFLFTVFTYAQPQKIKKADSLFRTKQYTQSMELYQSVFKEKEYSPAMLLKMAFIQEGLGKIGPTLFYLNLYYLASDDQQALQKMEELAAKFKLSGYSFSEADRLQRWISKNNLLIQLAIAGVVLMASFFFFLQRKKDKTPWAMAFVILIASTALVYCNNFYSANSVIVGNDRTYLMEGPSAGAKVVGIIGEGNQLEVLGKDDVWLKVKWIDKAAYVKKNSVLNVTL